MMFHRLPDSQKILASILTEHSDIDALISDLLNNLAACNEVLGKLKLLQYYVYFHLPMCHHYDHHHYRHFIIIIIIVIIIVIVIIIMVIIIIIIIIYLLGNLEEAFLLYDESLKLRKVRSVYLLTRFIIRIIIISSSSSSSNSSRSSSSIIIIIIIIILIIIISSISNMISTYIVMLMYMYIYIYIDYLW